MEELPAREVELRRNEFSKMAERLKSTIMLKDKDFLQELIDSPNIMKRKLMSKLVLERQDQISTQLTRIRMRLGKTKKPPEASSSSSNSSAAAVEDGEDADQVAIIEELEKDSK